MTLEVDVSPDELAEWRSHHVTRMVRNLVQNELDLTLGAFGRGELIDHENPTLTHGKIARAWGQLEALRSMIDYLDEIRPEEGQ